MEVEAGTQLLPPWNIGGDSNDAPNQSIALPHVPVKALDGRIQVTLSNCRIYTCERCHELVRICRYCDRGNRFCPPCAPLARAEKQRNAGKRYQLTNNGRLHHKVRQEQYLDRLEKNVTHHGDLGITGEPKSTTAAKPCASKVDYERPKCSPNQPSRPGRCDLCGRPCSRCECTRAISRRTHANRRGPRLPRYEMARRR